MITIVDYGMGNLGSVRNMFKKIGVPAELVSDPVRIREASKLVLPGVGAFDAGVQHLRDRGLLGPLHEAVQERKVPVLGICLGMQLMTKMSEEGVEPGLGWVDAEAVRFSVPPDSRLRIPHMGWNVVEQPRRGRLLAGCEGEQRFYFVHSYMVRCADEVDVTLACTHGVRFVAGFERGNVYGVQFHPEKSHQFGMRLFRNFAAVQ